MIWLWTFDEDPHLPPVRRELDKLGVEHRTFAFFEYPTASRMSYSFETNAAPKIMLSQGDQALDLSSVTGVWYRRPGNAAADHIEDLHLRQYVQRESAQFLSSLYVTLDQAYWLPHPRAHNAANSKPYQLCVANQLGFEIPLTVAGNDRQALEELFKRPGPFIIKSLYSSVAERDLTLLQKVKKKIFDVLHREVIEKHRHTPQLQESVRFSNRITIPTRKLSPGDHGEILDTVENCPVIVQQYVEKSFELRITIVGQRVFACRIMTQETGDEQTKVDWRANAFSLEHSRFDLPPEIERRLLGLMKRLNLTFGCVDMIVTPDGRYVFLEVNPNGQWMWVENMTGMPIAQALARTLVDGKVDAA